MEHGRRAGRRCGGSEGLALVLALVTAHAWAVPGTTRPNNLFFFSDDHGAELYDLRRDPKEMRNLIADPAAAAAVKEMSEELARLRDQLGAPGL